MFSLTCSENIKQEQYILFPSSEVKIKLKDFYGIYSLVKVIPFGKQKILTALENGTLP